VLTAPGWFAVDALQGAAGAAGIRILQLIEGSSRGISATLTPAYLKTTLRASVGFSTYEMLYMTILCCYGSRVLTGYHVSKWQDSTISSAHIYFCVRCELLLSAVLFWLTVP
jgi:hypothetical protein